MQQGSVTKPRFTVRTAFQLEQDHRNKNKRDDENNEITSALEYDGKRVKGKRG